MDMNQLKLILCCFSCLLCKTYFASAETTTVSTVKDHFVPSTSNRDNSASRHDIDTLDKFRVGNAKLSGTGGFYPRYVKDHVRSSTNVGPVSSKVEYEVSNDYSPGGINGYDQLRSFPYAQSSLYYRPLFVDNGQQVGRQSTGPTSGTDLNHRGTSTTPDTFNYYPPYSPFGYKDTNEDSNKVNYAHEQHQYAPVPPQPEPPRYFPTYISPIPAPRVSPAPYPYPVNGYPVPLYHHQPPTSYRIPIGGTIASLYPQSYPPPIPHNPYYPSSISPPTHQSPTSVGFGYSSSYGSRNPQERQYVPGQSFVTPLNQYNIPNGVPPYFSSSANFPVRSFPVYSHPYGSTISATTRSNPNDHPYSPVVPPANSLVSNRSTQEGLEKKSNLSYSKVMHEIRRRGDQPKP